MKSFVLILMITLSLMLVGCQKTTTSSSSDSNSSSTSGGSSGGSGGTTGGSGTTTTGGTSGGGPSTGGTCYGDYRDGTGSGYSLRFSEIMMAGHQNFVPSNSYGNEWGLMNLNEGKILFQSDYRLKVRFKVITQPEPNNPSEVYCYGRETGQSDDLYNYTKLKFQVYLRDVLEHKTTGALTLGNRYQGKTLDPVSVGSCSPIIDYSYSRNPTSTDPNYNLVSHVVEVREIRSDSNCQACKNNSNCNSSLEREYCPSEYNVRRASCWKVLMQWSTDTTQDFK